MDKIRKLHRKVISVFLSLLMVLSTVVGYIPASVIPVQAAGSSGLEPVPDGQSFTELLKEKVPDYKPSKEDVVIKLRKPSSSKAFNMDNDISPYKDSTKAYYFQKIEGINKSKMPSVTYYKAGVNTKNSKEFYNLTVTMKGYKTHNCRLYDENTGKTIKPYISFRRGNVGVGTFGLHHVDFSFKWTKYDEDGGVGSKINTDKMFTYVTLDDLDGDQSFRIPDSPNLVGRFKLRGTNHVFVDSNDPERIRSKPVATDPSEKKSWVTVILKQTDDWNMSFYEPQRYETQKEEPRPINNGGYPRGYYFGYTAKSIIDFEPEPDPTPTPEPPGVTPIPNEPSIDKRVGEKGCSWGSAEPAESPDEAFTINDYEDFDYLLKANSPNSKVERYEITDTLEDCLAIDDAAHVQITDRSGKDVTGNFYVEVTGNTITCHAKPGYLIKPEFLNQSFTVRYTAHRIKTEDVYDFMAPWIDETDGFTFYIPNHANMLWHDSQNGTRQTESNESWVTDQIGCELVIEKDAKYDDWKVGDYVTYTVEVSQVKQDGYAKNLVISDTDIPAGLKLVNNEWSVDGPTYGEAASISSDGVNGWIVTCPLLQYNDSVKIEFRCLATEEVNGRDWINTATAFADNTFDDYGDETSVSDSAEVWVNSPVLTVDKTANAYEYEVSDTVRYTVTVNNTADYTIAENIVVSDITLPEGLELQGDVTVDMGEAQTSIGWPVADGTTTISKEARENVVTVEPETTPYGNSWTVKAKYLPSQQPMQITFNCKATKTVNGIESQNVVTATADNFLSLDQEQEPLTAQDDAEVYVNTAAFDIEKTTPDYEWQVGDHVPFDITVRNINDENTLDLADDPKYADLSEEERAKIGAAGKTVARNVVITDADIPEGFILDFDTVDVTVSDAVQSAEDEVLDALNALGEEDTSAADAAQSAENEVLEALDAIGTEKYADEAQALEDEVLAELDALGLDEDSAALLEMDDMEFYDDEIDSGTDTDLPDPIYPEDHEPRPAEPMTVTGIPGSYDNHVPGTADLTNDVDDKFWNETEIKDINWNLTQEGNGWKLTISDLPAGNDVNVHFTCEATQPGNGQEGVNIGTITADNAITKSDDSEAYINTAALSIDKQLINKYAADGAEDAQDGREDYEFRVGEDVEYKLIVNNTQKGSIARNVVISDVTIPDGLELDAAGITVEGLPATFNNPVAGTDDEGNQLDPDHYKEIEILPVNYEVVPVKNGFQVMIDNLPCTTDDELNNWNQPVVITYHCTPTETVNGFEIINTGKAAADNASEVKDSERIWVNSPVLIVDKEADRAEYLPGDTITYRVDLIQNQTGCLARNITFHDVIDTPGVKLQKNSIVLIDSDGNVIEPAAIRINEDNSFMIETGKNLIKEDGYTSIDLDKADEETGDTGWQQMGSFNPPDVTRESRLSLEYAVEIVDGDLAGQTIHNKITANSDENIPTEDEAEVPIYGPALDIEKVSDKVEYQVGEEAFYSLTIRNIREDTIVKQVVIEDGFEKEGMVISDINVRLNGKNIDCEEIIRDKDNHFKILTGIDMNDTDKLEVHYKVVFTDPSLHGSDIINVASAKGENTDEEFQDNCVHIIDETPGLSIDKTSDKQEYKVGDTGHYKVVVKNTEKGTVARNVIIKDQLYVDGAKIIKDSIVIRNDAGKVMDDAEIQGNEYRYAIYTGHDLAYKEEMTVTYDVLFEQETLAGQDILNIARATCDNLRVETEEPDPVTLPNGLTLYKYSDPATGSVVKNGETITYHVSVKNKSNTDMKNVLVKDKIPEYTEYVSSEEQDGVITGTRTLNGKEYATFVIENLKAGDEKIVSFQVSVKDAPEEAMIFNVAQVRVTKFDIEDMNDDTWNHESFRNTNEVVHYTDTRWIKDENIVHIDSGLLDIDKVSDKTNYSVGEIGHYTVTVRQKVTGAVARNVVVNDQIQKKGAYIQKDSIKAYILREGAEEEEEIQDVHVTAKDYSYTVATNTNLKYGDLIIIRYDVLFKEASLEGQQIKNVASAKDDTTPEGEEPTDDNRVTVGEAGLIIEKTSDKPVYEVGEVGKYTLKVTCSDPARKIENVVIKDVMKQKGAHLVTGTVRTYYDSEELKVKVHEKDNGFVVETNHDLSGTHVMWVKYDVVFESPLLSGRDVENIATTWGDNTTPSDDEHIVHVPGDPGKPDKPTPTPDPGNPTPSPKPEEPKGGMTLRKTANKHVVSVGDIVSYTLEARVNSGTETAVNVVISDSLDPDYLNDLELVEDSIRSYIDNAEFHGESLNVTSSGFTLKTGKNLAPNQVLKVTYDVRVKSENLAGKTFKNIAGVSSDNMDPAKDTDSVIVRTEDPREGGMTLEKDANKEEVPVGGTISYTLKAYVNSGKDTAKNVILKDTLDQSVTKYVEIVRDSFRCYIDDAQFQPKELNITENGFTLKTGKDLAPGQVLKVTYDLKVKSEKLKGKNIKNTAEVSSDNMEPAKDNDIVNVSTDKPVEGGMSLEKKANKVIAKVGDTVSYTLEAKVNSGTEAAKNVVIKDAFDSSVSKYVKIDKDSFRCYIDNTEFRPKSLSLTNDGFTLVSGKDLKPGQIMKVTYDVLIESTSLEGKNVRNTAVVSSDNMEPGRDNENIVVDKEQPAKGGIDITKTSDHSRVNVGDTVKYTLTVRTTSTDTAQNVVIKDTLDSKAVLEKNSIKAYLDDQVFTPKKLSATATGFNMETGKDLKAGQTMKVVYNVRFVDESLGGKVVKNTAIADADNMDPSDDSADVEVNEPAKGPEGKPALSIDKVVNLSNAEVGDTLNYILTVKETVPDMVAKNVVIRDNFNVSGLKIGGVQVTLDGRSITANVSKTDSGMVIETGKDLAYGSVMKISYQAVIEDENLAGTEIGNTASASADNADEVAANASTKVKAPDPTETPDPDDPGQDDDTKKPDDPTNVVGPKTGLTNNAGVYAGIGGVILAIAAIAVYVMRRKRKK